MDKNSAMPDRPDARDVADIAVAGRAVHELEFLGVSFSYKAGTPVISDFNLRITGGTTVALVGPSGAGKTTFGVLLARFHDPTLGAIKLNGVDIRALKLSSYRQLLGVVQQDVFLFDGTVAENIAYGNPVASLEAMTSAAERANAHEFIRSFDDSYQTIIGERGDQKTSPHPGACEAVSCSSIVAYGRRGNAEILQHFRAVFWAKAATLVCRRRHH